MIQYRFKIDNNSRIASLENDEQAEVFSKFIGAEWERDTAIFRLKKDNKFCTFELEIGGVKNTELLNSLEFKNINIWEV
jgi:hypothetical protein